METNLASAERSLREQMRRMEELTEDYAKYLEQCSNAETTYKVKFASERFSARLGGDIDGKKMTQDACEDFAILNSVDERKSYDAARTRLEATKQALVTVRSQIDSLRSLMASYRGAGI